jgi:hypothetical protein
MINEVWLYTNRNCIVFDEKGEQMLDMQKALGIDSLEYWRDNSLEKALERVIADKPTIYFARWSEVHMKINLDELCCLLGKGQWYWEYKNRPNEVYGTAVED